MGCSFSKKPTPPPLDDAAAAAAATTTNTTIEYMSELTSYKSACQQDPDLQTFDSTLQQRTIGAISFLATSEINSLSFDTLRQVTGCLLDNNHQVVKIILDYKKDIWKNPELFNLVEEYFDHTLQTLDLCNALEKCLTKARDSQLIMHVALKTFEEEDEEEEGGSNKYVRTLEELKQFKAFGDPFTEELFRTFQSVYRQQISMLEKLQSRRNTLDKKLKSVKAWRRVSNVIFISAFATVLICSVVAAAIAAPPVAAALGAAASIPLGSMGKWIDLLWKRYSNVMTKEMDVITTMEFGTFVAISDLDSIRVLIDRLEIQIVSLSQNVDFAVSDEEAVKFGIEEIKKKLGEFMKSIEDLGQEVDRCSGDVRRARTVVLQRIASHPK